MTLRLRAGTEADRAFMRDVLAWSALASYPELASLGSLTLSDRLEGWFASYDTPERRWFLAEDAQGPVAGVWALGGVDPLREREEAVIVAIGVKPAARRQGYARILLRHAEQELRAAGARQLRLFVRPDNQAAWALYVALGYRPGVQELLKD